MYNRDIEIEREAVAMENVKLKDENMTTGTEKERLTVSGICKIVYAIWQRDIWILPCERTGELETHPRTRKKDTGVVQ